MKTNFFGNFPAIMVIAGLTALSLRAGAQSTTVTPAVPPPAVAPTPQLPYGAAQVIQLAQAKLGDDTIIAYVKNSGNSFNLDADQIIYLRQQGLSDAVISAMLNQPHAGLAQASTSSATTATSTSGSSASYDSSSATVSTASVVPTVTYVQTVPTYYYSAPAYYPYYYAGYPAVSIGIGYGWHGGWGCGWHGGWHGGGCWHR